MKTLKRQFDIERIIQTIKDYKFVVMGLVAVTILYCSVAGMISITTPAFSLRGDTTRHVDYVWRFYNGDIPRYEDKVTYQPFVDRGLDSYQNAAANPPFFYVLHAPIVGPFLNAGQWREAIVIGRAINLVIGVLCILALAWAGWLFGGKRKELFAVAVPALATLTYWFLVLNKYYALDALIVLLVTLSFITLYKLIQHGLKPRYLIALVALSIVGMLTKATFIVMLFTNCIGILMACVIKDKGIQRKNLIKATYLSAIMMVLVVLASGWFYYYWNYKTSGQWFRPFTDDTLVTGRPYKSFKEVLFSPILWSLPYAHLAKITVISTMITTFAVAGVLATKRISPGELIKSRLASWPVLLLAIAFAGTFATQIVHGVGYGSINFRYLLPAILPISLFLSYGLLEFERAKGQLVALAAIAMSGTTLLSIRVSATPEGFLASVLDWGKSFPKLHKLAADNGVPVLLSKGFLAAFVIGSILLSVSMFFLSKQHHDTAK